MTSIASSSASTLSPGVRRGPPIAATASQNAPAPTPSSTRPPLSRSRLAAARAATAGGGSGRVGTVGGGAPRGRGERRVDRGGGEPHPRRARRDVGQQRPGVEEPRLVRVVLEGDEVET